MPRFATHPTSSLLFLQSAISVVKFHCQLLDCFELGSSPWCGEPPRETSNAQPCVAHIAAFPACNGLGVPSGFLALIIVNGPSKVLDAPVPTPKGVMLEPISAQVLVAPLAKTMPRQGSLAENPFSAA